MYCLVAWGHIILANIIYRCQLVNLHCAKSLQGMYDEMYQVIAYIFTINGLKLKRGDS